MQECVSLHNAIRLFACKFFPNTAFQSRAHLVERASVDAAAVGVSLLALVGDLAEGELLLELAAELTVDGDEILAGLGQGLAGLHGAIRLDTEENLGHVGMSD